MIDSNKSGLFKSRLLKPKKEEVHVTSQELHYECVLVVSGEYIADYYRKAVHAITVDSNVQEVIIGDGIFQTREKSRLNKAFSIRRGKSKLDLHLEEHVFVKKTDKVAFDHHGEETEFSSKVNSKTVEHYPKRILVKDNVRGPGITYEDALARLQDKFRESLEPDIRGLNEEFIVQEISEVYVPIFEARLKGPKKKAGILRLDAVRKKIL